MKRFSSLLVVLVSMGLLIACVTLQATPEQEKSLSKVQEFPGIKKNVLFNKSLQYLARTYNSSNDVIQLKDPESGQIICKGLGSFNRLGEFYFSYTFIIDIKDGKIRTRFEGVKGEALAGAGAPDVKYNWGPISEKLTSIREGLFASITESKADDNW